jgi:hypothetical protein
MDSHPENQGELYIELLPSTIWQVDAEIKRGFTFRMAAQNADFGLFGFARQMDVSW